MSDPAHNNAAHLAHHFEHPEQQRQSSTLGMWIFLVTEVMFFGGLFCGYTIYRWQYPEAWVVGSHLLDMFWGGFNTVVLLLSSLTMVLAIWSSQRNKRNLCAFWIVVTMALGLIFLGVKVIEYSSKIEHHLVPNANFNFDPAHVEHYITPKSFAPSLYVAGHNFQKALEVVNPGNVRLFYSFYFTLTGLHAIHMIIGEGIMAVMLWMCLKGRFSSEYNNPLEISGLYWHFVDIVWIFLFPLLYLVGRH